MKKGPAVAAPGNWDYDLPIPVVWVDELIHTDDHPQCGDPTCTCAQHPTNVPLMMYDALLSRMDELNARIQNGRNG
jgi:hypothetical protein